MSKGFTLLELMVILSILAITVFIGIPAYALLTSGSTLIANTYTLKQDAVLARSDALSSGNPVLLCPLSPNSGTCGSDWSSGWVILPANATCQPTGASPLETQPAVRNTVNSTVSAVCFNRFGMPDSAAQWTVQSSSQSLCVEAGVTGHVVAGGCS